MAMAFEIGRRTPDPRWLYTGFAAGVAVSLPFLLAQVAGFQPVASASAPAGLFVNRNFLAEAALLAFVAVAAQRQWWLAAAMALCAALPMSRGVWMAGVICAAVWLWWRRPTWAIGLTVAGIAVAAALMASGYRLNSVEQRSIIWQATVAGTTWLGNGLGSFRVLYPRTAQIDDTYVERPDHAHGDLLEVAFETGLPGVVLFLGFAAALWGVAKPREQFILSAVLLEGLVSFPLHMPATAFFAAFAAGHAARGRHGLRDVLAGWRSALQLRLPLRAGLPPKFPRA